MAVTMQDVADAAGVSRATVSIVINGKQAERKIPQQTCDKVYEAMRQLGYQVNISAKKLRRSERYIPTIFLLYPEDQRSIYMPRFIAGIQRFTAENDFECETVIQTYKADHLEKHTLDFIQNNCNGVIAAGLSDKDFKVFESADIQTPVVLINTSSQKYTTVSLNTDSYVDYCLDLFSKKGHHDVGIVMSQNLYSFADNRARLFQKKVSERGLRATMFRFDSPNYINGGKICAEQMLSMEGDHPRGIYVDSDLTALGFMHACSKAGLRIPQDIEIISMGFLPKEMSQCFNPALSVLLMPLERMSYAAVKIIADSLNSGNRTAVQHLFEPELMIRDSFSF